MNIRDIYNSVQLLIAAMLMGDVAGATDQIEYLTERK